MSADESPFERDRPVNPPPWTRSSISSHTAWILSRISTRDAHSRLPTPTLNLSVRRVNARDYGPRNVKMMKDGDCRQNIASDFRFRGIMR